jgi:IS5 family transposase
MQCLKTWYSKAPSLFNKQPKDLPGLDMRSMPGNPYDGHTLAETLEQMGILTGLDAMAGTAIVDKGYRGVEIEGVRILRSGQRRGITGSLKAMIKRRSAIEPAIGHMKMDGRLGRNPLKGALGDAIHAVMCGAGHNLRLILAALRRFCARFGLPLAAAFAWFYGMSRLLEPRTA